ncbi:hypothetical protein DM860_001303 [Cuscuta australis]|uniref:Uncharacterized protein n=1 Tax=Cuscuta australis TaxID=267555 RepID=A0A328DXY7_9ASTE|nr:hypothetical protein DM860_001303 [Cuscuta australis]
MTLASARSIASELRIRPLQPCRNRPSLEGEDRGVLPLQDQAFELPRENVALSSPTISSSPLPYSKAGGGGGGAAATLPPSSLNLETLTSFPRLSAARSVIPLCSLLRLLTTISQSEEPSNPDFKLRTGNPNGLSSFKTGTVSENSKMEDVLEIPEKYEIEASNRE